MIENIKIPQSVIQIIAGFSLLNIKNIEFERDEYFINYNNKFILRKTDPNSYNYDVILHAYNSIKCIVTIPSFFRKTAVNAFTGCMKIQSESIENFLKIFDINDMNTSTWKSISKRLIFEINTKNDKIKKRQRQRQAKIKTKTESEKETKNTKKFIDIQYSNKNFEGIINYFSKHSKIEEEIKITSSSINYGDLQKVLQTNYPNNDFHTKSEPNSWICIEFFRHQIKPTNYTIRSNNWSSNGASHPKNWIFEGSNDLTGWETLSEEKTIYH